MRALRKAAWHYRLKLDVPSLETQRFHAQRTPLQNVCTCAPKTCSSPNAPKLKITQISTTRRLTKLSLSHACKQIHKME